MPEADTAPPNDTPPPAPETTPPPGAPPTPPAPPKPDADPASDSLGDAGKKALDEERKARKALQKQLDELRKSQMTDQEKAIAEAKASGLAEATASYGRQLAQAQFDAEAARAGVNLGDAAGLIDVGQFIGDDGQIDNAAIKKAVGQLKKLAPTTPSRSGGEFNGAPGGTAPITEDQLAQMSSDEIAKAYETGRLKHFL